MKKNILILILLLLMMSLPILAHAAGAVKSGACISGILAGGEPVAIINGQNLQEGESVGDTKVVRIESLGVHLEHDGVFYFNELGDGCDGFVPQVFRQKSGAGGEGFMAKIIEALSQGGAQGRLGPENLEQFQGLFMGFGLVMMIISSAISIVSYVYMAITLQMIAKKTETQYSWFAWIPFLSPFLMMWVAKKPLWWFLAMVFFVGICIVSPLALFVSIPFILVMWFLIFAGMAEARGKSKWWALVTFVPSIGAYVFSGFLAFSKDKPVISEDEEGIRPEDDIPIYRA